MASTPLRDGIRLLGRAAGRRSGVSDADLLDRFARHRDEAAFELLVWRHGALVLGTCRRLLRDAHEAEDAVQACFLVLARRAASVGRRGSVGGWLHRVAFRMALLAKARRAKFDARRRPLDDDGPPAADPDPAAAAEWREARRIIDEEVDRLPARYRVPFVLCCLEGRSNADVARDLGCPLGTVESRLTRARARLRTALGRRGVTLSAGLFATLSARDASAFIPARLVSTTAKAAVAPTAAGVVSTHVAALTEGVIQAMWLTKLKTIAATALVVAVLGTGTGVLWHQPAAADPAGPAAKAPATADADRVADLVKRLGGSAFAEREKAAKALEAIGTPALDALRQAARSDEPERKKRAEELVKRIEAKAVTAKMLTAKLVHLTYRNTPLADAVEDFKTKSGYDIALSDPTGALKSRKVTLDTGDVTFWQALDKVCDASGLTETVPPPAQRIAGGGGAGMVRGGGGRGGAGAGAMPVSPFVSPGRVFLAAGKRPALPTDDGSAVRVRAAGKGDEPAADGEIVLQLEIAPEPRLRWQRTVGVDIAKATDDQGRTLEQIRSAEAAQAAPPAFAPGRAVAGGGFGMAGAPPAIARPVSVRFKKPGKPSATLKELSGTVALQVLTEPEPYVTVDEILDAGGKSVPAADGGAVRVAGVSKLAGGRVQVKFGVEPPPGAPAGMAFHLTMRGARMLLTSGPGPTAEHEVSLVDGKGVSVPVISAGVQSGPTTEYTLVGQPAAGQDAAKLVVTASKSVTVEVPFTLRNVPVP